MVPITRWAAPDGTPLWLRRIGGTDDPAPGQPRCVRMAVFAGLDAALRVAEAGLEAASGRDAAFELGVASGWRRLGIGQRCIAALRQVALAQGARRLRGMVGAENAAALALMRRCGFRCEPRRGDAGVVVVELDLEARRACDPA